MSDLPPSSQIQAAASELCVPCGLRIICASFWRESPMALTPIERSGERGRT